MQEIEAGLQKVVYALGRAYKNRKYRAELNKLKEELMKTD